MQALPPSLADGVSWLTMLVETGDADGRLHEVAQQSLPMVSPTIPFSAADDKQR
jgi:hypothetical protein